MGTIPWREKRKSRTEYEDEDVSLYMSSSSDESSYFGCNILDYDNDIIESCTSSFDSFDSLIVSMKNVAEETYFVLSGFDNIGTSHKTSKIINGHPNVTDETIIMERMKFVSFHRSDEGKPKTVDNDIDLKGSSISRASFDELTFKTVNSPNSILKMKKPIKKARSSSSTSVYSLSNNQRNTKKGTVAVTKGISKKLNRISSTKRANALIMKDHTYRNGGPIYIFERNCDSRTWSKIK